MRRAVGEVMDRLGQVDVLVNNAGACIHRPSLEVTAEEWRLRDGCQRQRRLALLPGVRPADGGPA